jgi:hypothetical protein
MKLRLSCNQQLEGFRAASTARGSLTWLFKLLDQLESLDAFAESWLPG